MKSVLRDLQRVGQGDQGRDYDQQLAGEDREAPFRSTPRRSLPLDRRADSLQV